MLFRALCPVAVNLNLLDVGYVVGLVHLQHTGSNLVSQSGCLFLHTLIHNKYGGNHLQLLWHRIVPLDGGIGHRFSLLPHYHVEIANVEALDSMVADEGPLNVAELENGTPIVGSMPANWTFCLLLTACEQHKGQQANDLEEYFFQAHNKRL